jgi:hypothetical protein
VITPWKEDFVARKHETEGPVKGAYFTGRCHLHGGKTPAGIGSPHFKHGFYSKYVPEGWWLRSMRRSRRCRARKRDGGRCLQWAVMGDELSRCVAHQYVTAGELYDLYFTRGGRRRKS